MATNLFALEATLVQALRDALPPSVRVGSGANLVGRQSIAPLCPAVFVTPQGSEVSAADDDAAGDDAITVEDEIWTVTALVSFVRDREGLDATYQEAGELLGRVYDALHGMAVPGWRTLTYAGKEPPVGTSDGVCECSIDFTVTRAFAPAEP